MITKPISLHDHRTTLKLTSIYFNQFDIQIFNQNSFEINSSLLILKHSESSSVIYWMNEVQLMAKCFDAVIDSYSLHTVLLYCISPHLILGYHSITIPFLISAGSLAPKVDGHLIPFWSPYPRCKVAEYSDGAALNLINGWMIISIVQREMRDTHPSANWTMSSWGHLSQHLPRRFWAARLLSTLSTHGSWILATVFWMSSLLDMLALIIRLIELAKSTNPTSNIGEPHKYKNEHKMQMINGQSLFFHLMHLWTIWSHVPH